MDLQEKQDLFAQLARSLTSEYDILVAAHQATQAGATHEEAKPENDKDTRALEQSYLARGQAERVLQLEDELRLLKRLVVRIFPEGGPIALGALVQAQEENLVHHYLFAPVGAGEELTLGEIRVKVVTPRSPLGKALHGGELDDDVQVQSPTGRRLLSIVRIE